MNNKNLTQEIIGYLLFSRFKWMYLTKNMSSVDRNSFNYSKYNELPDMWRKSVIQKILFNFNRPDKIYIGNNSRYSKGFSVEDIGVKMKPILYRVDDKYELIEAGIAIDAETL